MAETVIWKARVLGASEIAQSNRLSDDPFAGQYGEILEPPYDLAKLAAMPELSNILPQCIAAMETNIDGFGYTLEPVPGLRQDENGRWPPEAEEERQRIRDFFEYCNPVDSFVRIRRKTRKDLEATGNGYWEILRNGRGEIAGIEHLESYTMRLTRLDAEPIEVGMPVLRDGRWETIPIRRRFRRYVQERDGRRVYFKEFGDPRPIDAKTGRVLTQEEVARKDVVLATEVIHFRIYSSSSPYGVPRWIGTLLAVLGSRQAEEINYTYFDNKAVPPLAILVSGRLASESVERIQNYIREELKGVGNFHKILVIEAEATPNPMAPAGQRAGIEIKPLTDAQQKDALFVDYDERNQEKVRSAFRLPPIYVGRSQDYTRATAEESRAAAEEQAFGPERDDFDWMINRLLFPAMGVRFWRFKSLSPTVDQAAAMTEMLGTFVKAGMTPREARRQMEEILNKELPDPPGADWLDTPLEIYAAKLRQGLAPAGTAEAAVAQEEAVRKFAAFLLQVRKELEEAESA